MPTKPSRGKSEKPTPKTKGQAKKTVKAVASKPTKESKASRPLGVTSSGSVKVNG